MSEGFNPNKSRVSPTRLADFIRAPITGKLTEVPGIGDATVDKLAKVGITSTFQLIGQYLSLKEEDVEAIEHAERFYLWLKSIDTPGGFRAGIVHAISERMNVTFPGIYDSSVYGGDQADEEDV